MSDALPLVGFLIGILIGLTGMGGGALMTPFLILIVGTRPLVAVGSDLVYGSVTKLVGAWLHWRQGTVDVALARRLATTSVPAGLGAALLLQMMPQWNVDADEAIRRMLGIVLIAIALLLLARLTNLLRVAVPGAWRDALRGGATPVAGAIVGLLVGFTSVGSGSLLIPFLLAVFPMRTATVVGTDVFHAAILVTASAVAHAQAGNVDWQISAALLIGSVPGVAVGTWLVPRFPARALRAGLASLLLITGVALV